VPLQEETLSRLTEVEEPLVEIFVDLPAELTMELLPSSPAMRVSLYVRLSDTRSFADFSIAVRFTRDQTSYGAEYNWFSLQRR